MVRIFGCDVSKMADNDFLMLYKSLCSGRKEKADRIKDMKAKKLSICAGALMQNSLSKVTGIPSAMLRYKTDDNGKPYAENIKVHFNLAHSYNLVLCAVSDNPIGIDTERIRQINTDIAKKYFTKREQEYVLENRINAVTRFFEIWTRKEAYVKMLGTGISDFLTFDSLNKKISTKKNGDYIISVTSEKFPEIEYVKKLHS